MSNVRVEKNGLVSQCCQIPKNALGHFDYDRQAGGAPLRKAIFQPAHFETTCAELRHRFVRQYAVRTATVGDDLLARVHLPEANFEFT